MLFLVGLITLMTAWHETFNRESVFWLGDEVKKASPGFGVCGIHQFKITGGLAKKKGINGRATPNDNT